MKLFRSNTATPSETFCRFLVAASQDDRLSRVRARRLSRLVARNGQRRSLHGFYAGR